MRVTRDRLVTNGLLSAVPVDSPIPADDFPHWWTWLTEDVDWVLANGVPAGGLRWDVGAPTGADKINRHAVAMGCDPSGNRPPVRVDLGPGLVRDVQSVDDELWVVVARRRFLAVPLDRGVAVLAVAASGAIRTVLAADTIDVSASAPPPRRPPDEHIRAHIDTVRRRFDNLDTYWHRADGTVSPLSDGLSGARVSVQGDWPDARLVVTLQHRCRPGLLLRRTLPLFDEQGSPIEHRYADIHLMEDLDTGYVAPADEAVDGVLDT